MAEQDRQADDIKTPRKPDILRAKDIIPGNSVPAGKGNGVGNANIPRFNLADDIMAEHRRMTGGRRKGPAGPAPIEIKAIPKPAATPLPAAEKPFLSRYGFSNGFGTANDPVIADIVARDIEQLCRGLRA